jgi:hypothetical protein
MTTTNLTTAPTTFRKVRTLANIIADPRVSEVLDERGDQNGYWVNLTNGFISTNMECSSIHEMTIRECCDYLNSGDVVSRFEYFSDCDLQCSKCGTGIFDDGSKYNNGITCRNCGHREVPEVPATTTPEISPADAVFLLELDRVENTPTHIPTSELTEMATGSIDIQTTIVGGLDFLAVTFPSFDLATEFKGRLHDLLVSSGFTSLAMRGDLPENERYTISIRIHEQGAAMTLTPPCTECGWTLISLDGCGGELTCDNCNPPW